MITISKTDSQRGNGSNRGVMEQSHRPKNIGYHYDQFIIMVPPIVHQAPTTVVVVYPSLPSFQCDPPKAVVDQGLEVGGEMFVSWWDLLESSHPLHVVRVPGPTHKFLSHSSPWVMLNGRAISTIHPLRERCRSHGGG